MSKLDKQPYMDKLEAIYTKINRIRVGLWEGLFYDFEPDIDEIKAVRDDILNITEDTTTLNQLEINTWEELSFLNYTRRLLDSYIECVEYDLTRKDVYENAQESCYILSTKADAFVAKILLYAIPEVK